MDHVTNDTNVGQIERALAPYQERHPVADIKVRRENSASVRIRIIDPAFRGRGLAEREDEIWPAIEALAPDVREEITMLLLLAPEEAANSLVNTEFEHPLPSRI
ncbi:MAG TPA: hypothetical protein VGY55_23900 [Pirellulales bacterium]|jgi:hypothetical protein|nr:hypothetical protein [Pirellulales bacterium]